MANKTSVNIGARLDRLPQSKWHVKIWLVTAFALLVCWSNGIGGSVQNILLNELHWLEPGSTLLAMWGTTYTAGQLFGALIGGPIGDKIGRKKEYPPLRNYPYHRYDRRRSFTEHRSSLCVQTPPGSCTRRSPCSSFRRLHRVCSR